MRACDTNLSREAPTEATKQQGHKACSKHSLLRPPNPRVNCLWLSNPTPCCRSQGPPCAASSESQEHVATGSSRLQAHTQPSHPIPSGTASPQPKKGKNLQSSRCAASAESSFQQCCSHTAPKRSADTKPCLELRTNPGKFICIYNKDCEF